MARMTCCPGSKEDERAVKMKPRRAGQTVTETIGEVEPALSSCRAVPLLAAPFCYPIPFVLLSRRCLTSGGAPVVSHGQLCGH